MKYCHECKKWVNGEPKFCSQCGLSLDSVTNQKLNNGPMNNQKTSKLDWSLLFAITFNILLLFTPWILMWFVFVPTLILCILTIYRGNRKSGIALLVFCILVYGLSRQFSPFNKPELNLQDKARSIRPQEESQYQSDSQHKTGELAEDFAARERKDNNKHTVRLVDWLEFNDFQSDSGNILRPRFGKWFLILFEVKNNGDKPLSSFGWSQQIIDSNGRKYDEGREFAVTNSIKRQLEKRYPDIMAGSLISINPDCTGKFLVLFDIPKHVVPVSFLFKPNRFDDFEMEFPIIKK